jgi:putative transposase
MVTQPETGPACVVVCEWDVERLCRYGARGALALERLSRAEEASVALEAAATKEPMTQRTPRVDQAELLKRTFDFDVFA